MKNQLVMRCFLQTASKGSQAMLVPVRYEQPFSTFLCWGVDSVSIPHKEEALRLCDVVDPVAKVGTQSEFQIFFSLGQLTMILFTYLIEEVHSILVQ